MRRNCSLLIRRFVFPRFSLLTLLRTYCEVFPRPPTASHQKFRIVDNVRLVTPLSRPVPSTWRPSFRSSPSPCSSQDGWLSRCAGQLSPWELPSRSSSVDPASGSQAFILHSYALKGCSRSQDFAFPKMSIFCLHTWFIVWQGIDFRVKIIFIQFLKILLDFLKSFKVSVQNTGIFISSPLYAIFYFSLQKLFESFPYPDVGSWYFTMTCFLCVLGVGEGGYLLFWALINHFKLETHALKFWSFFSCIISCCFLCSC